MADRQMHGMVKPSDDQIFEHVGSDAGDLEVTWDEEFSTVNLWIHERAR